MTTHSNFVSETPLTDHDDRVKLWGFWSVLGLVIAIVYVLLQVAFVVLSPSRDRDLRVTPAAADHAAGVFSSEVRR